VGPVDQFLGGAVVSHDEHPGTVTGEDWHLLYRTDVRLSRLPMEKSPYTLQERESSRACSGQTPQDRRSFCRACRHSSSRLFRSRKRLALQMGPSRLTVL